MKTSIYLLPLVFILYIVCALSFFIAKGALSISAPLFFVACRMILAGSIFLSMMGFTRKFQNIALRDYWLFGAVVFFHIYIAYVFDLISLQYMSASVSAFLFNASPFITALIEFFMFGKQLTAWQMWALFLALVSFTLGFSGVPGCGGLSCGLWWPEIMLLCSIVASCIGWVSCKKLIARGYSMSTINGFGMFIGGFLVLLTSALYEGTKTALLVTNWSSFILITALSVFVSNIFFYTLYLYLLKFFSATFLSLAGSLCPFFSGIIGYLFFHEQLPGIFWISLVLVMMSTLLFYKDEL